MQSLSKHNSCGERFVVLTIPLVKTTIVVKTKSFVPCGLRLTPPCPFRRGNECLFHHYYCVMRERYKVMYFKIVVGWGFTVSRTAAQRLFFVCGCGVLPPDVLWWSV